jgi:hypothetical protein
MYIINNLLPKNDRITQSVTYLISDVSTIDSFLLSHG